MSLCNISFYLQVIKVSIQPGGDTEVLTDDWQFGLFEVDSSHHAAICVKKSGEIQLSNCVLTHLLPLISF